MEMVNSEDKNKYFRGKINMFKKIADCFIKTAEDLNRFDSKVQSEVEKYSNKQAKKVAIVCSAVFFIVGLIIGKMM